MEYCIEFYKVQSKIKVEICLIVLCTRGVELDICISTIKMTQIVSILNEIDCLLPWIRCSDAIVSYIALDNQKISGKNLSY